MTIATDVERQAQLVGDRLRERGADVLADLGLAGVDGDRPVLVDVQPGAELARLSPRRLRPPRPDSCASTRRAGRSDDEAAAEHPQEVAALELEPVAARLGQLVALDFDARSSGDPGPCLIEPLRSAAHRSPPLPSICMRSAASWTARTIRG